MAGVNPTAWWRSTHELIVPGIMQTKEDGSRGGAWRSTGHGFDPCLDCWTRRGHLVPVGWRGLWVCTHGGAS